MKKIFVITLILFTHFVVFSQIKYEKGYFIDNENNRTDCLIKNIDWKNNPTRFDYKITEKTQNETKDINNIKEFAINNYSKYIRARVSMDTSGDVLNNMSQNQLPETKEFTVFLKVLVEGNATLFYYEKSNMKRFFAQIDNDKIEPLFYKHYINNKNVITDNAQFRQYLHNKLVCNSLGIKDFKTLKYTKTELIELFEKYNACRNPNIKPKNTLKHNKTLVNIKLIGSINRSSLDVHYFEFHKDNVLHFDNKITTGIGTEIECIMPFNKNKWGVFAAPNFYFYKVPAAQFVINRDFKSFELPVNIRYYMFLNTENKLFINSGLTLNKPISPKIDILGYAANMPTTSSVVMNFGVGYTFKNWSAEMRHYRPRNILVGNTGLYSDFNKSSLILSYKF